MNGGWLTQTTQRKSKPKTLREVVARYSWAVVVKRTYGTHVAWDIYEWNLFEMRWKRSTTESGYIEPEGAKAHAQRRSDRTQKAIDSNREPPSPMQIASSEAVIDM